MMSTLTYENRLSTLRQIAADAALDAIALMPASNLTYVTGAHLHMRQRSPSSLSSRSRRKTQ